MSLKDRLQIKLNPAFYWRLAFWLFSALFLAGTVTLWLSAGNETTDALASGRRMIIRLSDGSFEKTTFAEQAIPTSGEKPPPEASPMQTPANPPQNPETPAIATPTASPATEAPATVATPTMTTPVVEAPVSEAPIPESTAAIPLNPFKDSVREKLAVGILPIIASDGTKPWRYYAKPYALKGNHPMIAIVVSGLGQNKNVTTAAIKLPENISLSFSPYAKDVSTWSNSARATGHEIMVDLPLEPTNYPASDPGPYGLLVSKSAEENASRLQWLMSRIQGYTGFVTANNEAYSLNDPAFKRTLELLNVRGLMLVMPHEPVRKETMEILGNSKLAYTMADSVLDEELSVETIHARLTALEKIATKHGMAVGYTHGIPLTIQELASWSATLEERGFTLVPVTYITSHKFKE